MRIVLAISSIIKSNPGVGGHYFSLLETAKQLSKQHEVVIVNIGDKKAIALQNTEFKTYFITVKGAKILTIHYAFKKLMKEVNPDIIHGFDVIAYFWCRSVGNTLNKKYSFTKCGGRNLVYLPYAKHIVLFSEENRNHIQNLKKFKNSNLHLIPNRIVQFDNDEIRIQKIKEELGELNESFKFLRISRIQPYYKKSAEQIINLVNTLNSEGVECTLIFIGIVEDEDVFSQLKEMACNRVIFFTTKEFTKNAKQLINIADAVLGAGRSLMEAAAKSKVLLCPIKQGKIPLLIHEHNYHDAFKYNFSERVDVHDYDEEKNYNLIKKMVLNSQVREEYSAYAMKLFKQDFDANRLCEKYTVVFNKMSSKQPKKYFDFILHYFFVLRKYIIQ